ncbi:hypothetical protein [Thauera aromatica]|uniref:hypothetical protein n=1 Tax=Thauera aromatica TaxID=59405 RepID=UPI001FFD829B|nr:hypothetical protein [Thauera aromatica]MCK2097692.1 hypothetical protein [Thauera aromatica]
MACLHFYPHLPVVCDHVHAADHAEQDFAGALDIDGEGRIELAEHFPVALQGVVDRGAGLVLGGVEFVREATALVFGLLQPQLKRLGNADGGDGIDDAGYLAVGLDDSSLHRRSV